MKNVKPFTSLQKECIARGQILNEQLSEKVYHALGKSDLVHNPKRHHYIASNPGAGKTYTVQSTADKNKIELIKIQGVASMNAIAISLACAAYLSKDKEINVWIDDCDSIFMDSTTLSVMKGVLDEDRNILSWNKNLTAQINIYEKSANENDQLKAEALRFFQDPTYAGVNIPTDNMRFIITSNRFLTPPNSILSSRKKMDEAAIRDRVIYTEYKLDKNANWGWIAYTFINSKILNMNLSQKHTLLDWMFINWDRLPATSMRAIKELSAYMLNYPENYPDYWESSLISTYK